MRSAPTTTGSWAASRRSTARTTTDPLDLRDGQKPAGVTTWAYQQPHSNPPGQPCDGNVVQWEWGYLRTGLSAWGQGTLQNNLFSDSVALDNMGVGVSFGQPYPPARRAATSGPGNEPSATLPLVTRLGRARRAATSASA